MIRAPRCYSKHPTIHYWKFTGKKAIVWVQDVSGPYQRWDINENHYESWVFTGVKNLQWVKDWNCEEGWLGDINGFIRLFQSSSRFTFEASS